MNIKIVSFLVALSLAPIAHANDSEVSSSEYSETARPRDPRGPRGPRGPGWPGWPGGPRYQLWECASQNARGYRFFGVDRSRHWAQREAQNRCLRRSRICRSLGCRTIR